MSDPETKTGFVHHTIRVSHFLPFFSIIIIMITVIIAIVIIIVSRNIIIIVIVSCNNYFRTLDCILTSVWGLVLAGSIFQGKP